MQYVASLPFSGNTDKAFGLAVAVLTAVGFRLTARTGESVEMVGPGMRSTEQSALVGASRIHIRSDHGELTVKADLGGVEWMTRFVMLFPLGLCLTLGIVFAVVFGPRGWLAIAAIVGVNALL